jgi:hypothetical protein
VTASRRTIASFATYPEAGHAVDWLTDHGFALERAAKVGAAQGTLMGALFAVLFGVFFTGPAFGELLVFSLALGGVIGAGCGVLTQHAASGGQGGSVPAASIEADHYDVQVDTDVAEAAQRTLGAMPAHADTQNKEEEDG